MKFEKLEKSGGRPTRQLANLGKGAIREECPLFENPDAVTILDGESEVAFSGVAEDVRLPEVPPNDSVVEDFGKGLSGVNSTDKAVWVR